MSVKLRQKKLNDGGFSLYLDIIHNGRRSYQFLDLQLGSNKEANKENIRIAETIRAKKEIELNTTQYGLTPTFKTKTDFISYFEAQELKTKEKNAIVLYLKEFSTGISISSIDKKWLLDFQNFLLKKLSNNSARHYWMYINKVLNRAVNDGIILKNPCAGLESIKGTEVEKSFLTFEEVQKLADTPCNPETKRAFLFSCFTGLRISDVRQLRYSDIENDRIKFRQQKTGRIEYLPINETARTLIEKRSSNIIDLKNDFIFRVPPHETLRLNLKRWARRAGIDKNISFHTARHTCATIALTSGVDLYTVSKMLGHKSLQTTQIYAKIVDEKLKEAVNKLPSIDLGAKQA